VAGDSPATRSRFGRPIGRLSTRQAERRRRNATQF
jgi:hypothetical protein